MYSWEIYNFLKEKDYCLCGNDLLKIISLKENPQLSHIKFLPFNNAYEMWDKDGNYFYFNILPFEEHHYKRKILKK